jgi:hypothetical protein
MNYKSGMLGIAAIVAVGLFLFGDIVYSEKDHVQNTRTSKEKIKSEPDQVEHNHMTPNHDEGEASEGHMAHGETGLSHGTDHEEHGHDDETHGQSVHRDAPDHEVRA